MMMALTWGTSSVVEDTSLLPTTWPDVVSSNEHFSERNSVSVGLIVLLELRKWIAEPGEW